jgi:hypothetical protein
MSLRSPPARPTAAQLQRLCDDFNRKFPVGTKVMLRKDSGPFATAVRRPAYVAEGHSAVAFFENVSGCYSIEDDRVTGAGDTYEELVNLQRLGKVAGFYNQLRDLREMVDLQEQAHSAFYDRHFVAAAAGLRRMAELARDLAAECDDGAKSIEVWTKHQQQQQPEGCTPTGA